MKKILLPIILGIFVFALIWGFSGAGDDSGAKAKFKTTESASDKIWIAGDQGGGPRAIDKQIDGLYPNPSPAAHEEEEGLAADVTQEKKPIHDTLKEDVWGSKADEEDVLAADTWGEAFPNPVYLWATWMAKPTIKFDKNENRKPAIDTLREEEWACKAKTISLFPNPKPLWIGEAVPDEILFSLTIGAAKPTISFERIITKTQGLHDWVAFADLWGGAVPKAISFGVENSWAKPTVIMIKADDDETRAAFFGAGTSWKISEEPQIDTV